MIEQLGIRPDDRVLLLSIPELGVVREIAGLLERGGVACLGGRDAVHDARAALADLRNVMFHPGPPEDAPFPDGFFSKVLDLMCEWEQPAAVAKEIHRMLSHNGLVFLAAAETEPLLAVGLVAEDVAPDGFRTFRKPAEPRPRGPLGQRNHPWQIS